MNETDAAADRASLVPGVHRLIRAIDGKDGPFSGTLVAFDETVAVCVDAEQLGGWAGWAFSGSEHVCGVLDIRRRADGHDALLPWCTQHVETFLGRRDASDSPLAPGELGTLVASLLRGVRELGPDADVVGDWWLTGDGRPMFVHGEGGSASARTAALIERLARRQADRATVRVLEEASAALRQPRHPVGDDRRWEEHLFARAAPRALQLDVFAPERASDITPRLVAADVSAQESESGRRRRRAGENRTTALKGTAWRSDRDRSRSRRRQERTQQEERSNRRRMLDGLRRRERSVPDTSGVLRALADRARTRLERLREGPVVRRRPEHDAARAQPPRPSRRRSVLVAGSLGAAVLIGGLLWPSDPGETPAEASSQKVQEPDGSDGGAASGEDAEVPPTSNPDPVPSEPQSESGAALDALPALLEAVSVCARDAVEHCADAVAEGARTPSDGVAVLGPSGSTATLVDDYGDVAVIRLTPIASEITYPLLGRAGLN
ncbi:hypothetical protein [Microbacterium sp. TWP3-1-2b2]|uniref:hypothetical protein n=1 Tax=Microbacterium sp. TWP3-1-2b2 TaxID=2804651 RepID=UPI003CEFA32E